MMRPIAIVERLEAEVARLGIENGKLREELAAVRKANGLVDPAGLPAITEAQAAILRTFLEARAAMGCSPTIRELAGIHGYASPHGANVHVGALERKGWLRRTTNRRTARGLVPTVTAVPADKIVPGLPRRAIA